MPAKRSDPTAEVVKAIRSKSMMAANLHATASEHRVEHEWWIECDMHPKCKLLMEANEGTIAQNPSLVCYHDRPHPWTPECESDPVCNPVGVKVDRVIDILATLKEALAVSSPSKRRGGK